MGTKKLNLKPAGREMRMKDMGDKMGKPDSSLQVVGIEKLKYHHGLSMDGMTIDERIAGMLNQYREPYAFHLANALPVAEIQKQALLFIVGYTSRNPEADLEQIQSIISLENPERFRRTLDQYRDTHIRNTPLYTAWQAEHDMVSDDHFRGEMFQVYRKQMQPGLKRFVTYEEQLQKLTEAFVDTLSEEDLRSFTLLYGEYRRASEQDKDDLLVETKSEYAHLIRELIAFEDEYQDIIQRDIANVREKVYLDLWSQKLDQEADTLRKEDYGILFPYLHLAKTIHILADTEGSDPFNGYEIPQY